MNDISIVDMLYLFGKIDTETWIIWGYIIPGIVAVIIFIQIWRKM